MNTSCTPTQARGSGDDRCGATAATMRCVSSLAAQKACSADRHATPTPSAPCAPTAPPPLAFPAVPGSPTAQAGCPGGYAPSTWNMAMRAMDRRPWMWLVAQGRRRGTRARRRGPAAAGEGGRRSMRAATATSDTAASCWEEKSPSRGARKVTGSVASDATSRVRNASARRRTPGASLRLRAASAVASADGGDDRDMRSEASQGIAEGGDGGLWSETC